MGIARWLGTQTGKTDTQTKIKIKIKAKKTHTHTHAHTPTLTQQARSKQTNYATQLGTCCCAKSQIRGRMKPPPAVAYRGTQVTLSHNTIFPIPIPTRITNPNPNPGLGQSPQFMPIHVPIRPNPQRGRCSGRASEYAVPCVSPGDTEPRLAPQTTPRLGCAQSWRLPPLVIID